MKNMDGIEREYADMSNSIACLVIDIIELTEILQRAADGL